MLLRLYRLTDKLGIFILKMGAAAADWLADGATAIVSITGRGTGGLFGMIVSFVVLVAGIIWTILKGIANGIGTVLQLIWKGLVGLFNLILRLAGVAAPGLSRAREAVSTRNSEAMARRAARDEIDVVIKEDPLKVQNRRLSFLVLILGAALVAAVIFVTDPGRIQQAVPVAVVSNNDGDAENTNPEPTVEGFSAAPTVIPTATPLPAPLQPRGAIAYTVREQGQTDIWAMNVGASNPIRITNNAADERDPEWEPNGTRLAYAARIDGNWDIYVYDPVIDATSRLTVDLSFQANPTWSPDGALLAYESYVNDNLDIYALPIDGTSGAILITDDSPAPDFSPAWSPDGRRIAFVSLRDGNQDIYVINLDTLTTTNITNTPTINEDYPAWSPDGRSIAYSALEPGNTVETIFLKSVEDISSEPQPIAVGRTPNFAPDGNSLTYAVDTTDGRRTDIFAVTVGDSSLPILIGTVMPGSTAPNWTLQPLPASLVNSGGLPIGVTDALYIEQTDTFDGNQFELQSLGNVETENAFLSDAVNDSFRALRQAIFEDSGRDYLQFLDDAFWTLDRPADFGEPGRNWHRTGRAFAVQRNDVLGFPPEIEIVRENIGNQVYWRLFVRVDEETQRGQLGEPLRELPWDFLSTENDVDAFNQGGRLRREVPSGYYVDFTILAADYGWERVAAGSDWVANERARNFWLFIKDDNLSWCAAMLQLYTEGQLVNYECTG